MGTDEAQGPMASVFGLSRADLHPVVEAAVGEPVASFEITIEHELIRDYYGFAADKLIPTFRYVTVQGRHGQVTVFVKHPHNPAAAEPEQYRFLRQHGVPLPDLYGVLRSPEGRPVLFLEYLDMGELTRPSLPPNVRLEFLSLMARFNAVHPSAEYAAWLKGVHHQYEDDPGLAWVIDVVWERACDGGLGEALKQFCSEDETRRLRLRALADRLAAQVNDMEPGLVSGDLSFENTGRRQSGERVMFDLEGICLGARFTDVSLVGRPDDRWPPPPYTSREALVEHYLREYVRWGGTAPPLDQFLAETRVLWLHGEVLSLNFGAGWGHTDSRAPEHQRQASRRGVLEILTMLVEQYC